MGPENRVGRTRCFGGKDLVEEQRAGTGASGCGKLGSCCLASRQPCCVFTAVEYSTNARGTRILPSLHHLLGYSWWILLCMGWPVGLTPSPAVG